MSNRPAPSRAVPGPTRRQNTLKGCMGALPQMFQWSRVLGSNNKCIATPADVQLQPVASEKQTRTKQVKWAMLQHQEGRLGQLASVVSKESANMEGSSIWKLNDGSVSQETVAMDLRQVLHAKQEPFVLEDVIREKRQPMRTPSSRELKFEAPPTRRSLKMKNTTTSKDHDQAAGDGYATSCQSQCCVAPKTPTGSGAVVRRNRVPVESMVAMPSHQAPAVGGGHSATKAHSKAASLGRNPVKSPNKRALLMEAAARILEGSNRRTSKRPSITVRSLLEDLEKPKHVKELSKPKEKLVRAVALHSELSEREEVSSPIVAILGERAAETKQHQFLSKHNNDSSCNNHFEMSQIVGGDLLVMQNRVFPYSNAMDEAEVVPSLATPVQNLATENYKSECAQLHDDLCSAMKGIQKQTMSHIVRGFELNSSKALLQAMSGAVAIVLPEVIITEDQRPEVDYDAILKDIKAVVPSKSIDSHAHFLPVMVMMSSCLPNFEYRTPSLITSFIDYAMARNFIRGYHAAAPLFPVVSPEKSEGSSTRTTRRSLIEGADETGYTHRSRDKFVEAEKSIVVQLRLCNYSWWASCQNNSPENQLSTEYCAGYGSPVAARCPYLGKVWNEEMSEEGSSSYGYPVDGFQQASSEYEELELDGFQQASPVSVLEPVYEEELELDDDSFDSFEEARQKLLEKVRRYEMLAHMDVDTLKKVSEEEHACDAWDDIESWETDCDSSSGASDSSSQASPAHEFASRDNMEAQDSSTHLTKEPYVLFVDDQSRYEQLEVGRMRPPAASALDLLTEKLELRAMSCRGLLQSSQRVVVRGQDQMKEVVGITASCNSGKSIAGCVVNSLLHKDLAMSNWNSPKQEEEEEVELELESCFFEILMCELLSDLAWN